MRLYVERGYEQTTVAEIAGAAGLTARTFFRHFADKREVLFGGQERLTEAFTSAIGTAPPSATTTECLSAALEAVEVVFTPQRHEFALQRRAVIAAHSELQERELLKMARLGLAVAEALRARGADDITARLAAEVGMLAFSTAFARWAEPGNEEPFPPIAHAALRELQDRAAALGAAGTPA